MNDSPDLPLLPVVLGVTGHRDPRPGDEIALKKAVRLVIEALRRIPGGEHLVIASALAEGADQLVTEVALEHDPPLPLIALAPMPLADYLETFETEQGKQRLHDMWGRASLHIELPWMQGHSPSSEAQFEQLGLVLSRFSHVLLALWNGDDTHPKQGGTAQIVAMRRRGERIVAGEGLSASPLFEDIPPLLELTRSGPVIQVFTPRQHGSRLEDDVQHEPGAIFGLSDALSQTDVAIARVSDLLDATKNSFASFAAAKEDFFLIQMANKDLNDTAKNCPHLCKVNEGYLSLSPAPLQPALELLRRRQACADVTASRFQRRILGEWTPGLPWSDSYKVAKARGGWFPQPGVLLAFACAVPLAAMCFEYYAHVARDRRALILYMAILVIASGFYLLVVRPWRWQEKFQDYRALAEALRVQFYWAACGLPNAVSDNYLRQHADELGWIRQALRGPALLGIASALASKSKTEQRSAFLHWTTDQRNFFVGTDKKGGKSKTNLRAKKLIDLFLILFLIGLTVSAGSTLAVDLLRGAEHRNELHEWLIASLGGLPAFVAALIFIAESRSYEAHAHIYQRAGSLHDRAARIETEMGLQPGTKTWRELILELGQEALAENARWLINHRERRIAMRIG